jgi:hypothetical protein
MRALSTILILGGLAIAASRTSADRLRRCVGPDGRVAEVRARPRGGEAVWIDGRLGWPESDARAAPRITTPLVWSRRGDAVAFAAREGHTGGSVHRLVVVVAAGGDEPVAITWAMPQPARVVTWLGDRRVGAGPSALDPKVVASFSTSR